MKNPSAPVRWAEGGDGVSPALQNLLRQAEADTPSKAELRALSALVGLGAAVHVGTAANSLGQSASIAQGGAGSAAGGTAGGGIAAGGATVGSSAAAGTGVSALWLKSLALIAALGAGASAYVIAGSEPEPEKPEPASGAALSAAAPAQQSTPPSPAEAPNAVPAELPPENAEVGTGSELAQPTKPAPAAQAPLAAKGERSSEPQASTELSLLSSARAALKNNPKRALALAKEHERRFPQGQLRQEREVIVIEALRSLGQTDHARRRGEQFEQRYPDSAHKKKVHESLDK